MAIPYQIAVLVYIFNDAGALLLLHRKKPPNQHLYSPIGGKLEQRLGESPYACALREIEEETGAALSLDDIRLFGIVSEKAYGSVAGGESHWLMFCFEVTRTLNFAAREFDEGRLEWIDPADMEGLTIPRTDREVIWPLVRRHSRMLHGAAGKTAERNDGATGDAASDGFFSVHIDCTDPEHFAITREHPRA